MARLSARPVHGCTPRAAVALADKVAVSPRVTVGPSGGFGPDVHVRRSFFIQRTMDRPE
jgi:hypothetical protein